MFKTFTYAEVGATEHEDLPRGYGLLRYRAQVGRGRAAFTAAGTLIRSFGMHRATGARVTASAPVAAPGVTVTVRLGLGPLAVSAPCEVVWAADGDTRSGFGYGTLAGHPFTGEESFVATLTPDGAVWLEITAFSRPARWYTKLGLPVARLVQHFYARRCAAALRRAL